MLLLKHDSVKPVAHAERQLQFTQSVALDGAIDPQSLDENMLSADAIEINLAAFNDGRGLSLARFLRLNKGFTGILRATGNILPDQLQAVFQLGFDEVLIGDVSVARHSEQDWLEAHGRLANQTLPAYVEADNNHPSIWSGRIAANR